LKSVTAAIPDRQLRTEEIPITWRPSLLECLAIFLGSCVLLFLGMSLHPYPYDEGLVLTAAMRVAAGQVPHRDFYANYGPAQFYILAGLFKLFGSSVFVERLYCLCIEGMLVVTMYVVAGLHCRRSIAACTALLTVVWIFGIGATAGSPIMPALLINILGCVPVCEAFTGPAPRRLMAAAGALAGLGFLFRYDTGIALVGIQCLVIAIAVFSRTESSRFRAFLAAVWPCLAGFTAVTLLPVVCYLSVAPLQAVLHDIVLYPSKYYRAARGLPFPGLSLRGLDNIALYLPLVIIGTCFYIVVKTGLDGRQKKVAGRAEAGQDTGWCGFLLTYSILGLVMYFKGIVRISLPQEFLSIIPTLLPVAVLFERRATFSRPMRGAIVVLVWLSVFPAVWASLKTTRLLYLRQDSVPRYLWSSMRNTAPAAQRNWCRAESPMTRGFCFSSDDDRIRAIEFIEAHTGPGQKLFVGLPQHDRIIINDNLFYFASGRLPATHWSHFDPDLQNRYDIQTRMIQEFNVDPPGYIVEDAEYAGETEPNDSSKSTGVTLLDEYIHRNYRQVEAYGNFTVWQRISTP